MSVGIHIFRRDLRIIDNNGLNLLSGMCNNLYTIFIFTPEQVTGQNKYKSNNAVQFMIQSLANLASEIEKRGGPLKYEKDENKQKEAEIRLYIKPYLKDVHLCDRITDIQ